MTNSLGTSSSERSLLGRTTAYRVGMALDHGPTRAHAPGETVTPEADRLGPYRLVSRLGEGGMGVVHLGLDAHGRAVAIKVLRPHVAYDPEARWRLEVQSDFRDSVRHYCGSRGHMSTRSADPRHSSPALRR